MSLTLQNIPLVRRVAVRVVLLLLFVPTSVECM